MKKGIFTLTLALVVPLALNAADESKDHLLKLFNSRIADNPKRFIEAAYDVNEDAVNGLILSQFSLACLSDVPEIPKEVRSGLTEERLAEYRSKKSQIEYFAKNKGNAFAYYLMSLCATNAVEREQYLRKAAERNNEQSLNELGELILVKANSKLDQVQREYRTLNERGASEDELKKAHRAVVMERRRLSAAEKDACGLFRRAADRADTNGCYNYGLCLLEGKGCDKNEARAIELLGAAGKDGHPKALSLLGICYREGIGCTPDAAASVASIKLSADLGNADGLYNYGYALLHGIGIERDEKLALKYLRKAADRRVVGAMNEYARCLLDGVGFDAINTSGMVGPELDAARAKNAEADDKRCKEAVAWLYHCATELNNPTSMTLLARCLRDGRGVDRRPDAAVYWFYVAAMSYGDTEAMNALADCCEKGIGGLAKSHENALWWKTRARATAGDRAARIWIVAHDPHRFDSLKDSIGTVK